MRIEPIGMYPIVPIYIPRKRRVSTTKNIKAAIDQYNKALNKHYKLPRKNNKPLKAHTNFFDSLFLNKDNFVKNTFSNQKDVISKLKQIIFSTKIGNTVKNEFNVLNSKNKIEVGLMDKELNGHFCYEMDNVNNSKIFLRGNQSISMMASTLIHELKHFKDLLHSAKSRQYLTIFELETNAFADQYELLNELKYTNSKEYQALKKHSKDLFEYSQKYVYKNKINNVDFIKHLWKLLSLIGYNKEELHSRAIPKIVEYANNTINFSTSDFLKARSSQN